MLHQRHAVPRQRIDVRCDEEWHAAIVQRGALVLVGCADVAEAEVIAQNEDDVRAWRRLGRAAGLGSTRQRPTGHAGGECSGQFQKIASLYFAHV